MKINIEYTREYISHLQSMSIKQEDASMLKTTIEAIRVNEFDSYTLSEFSSDVSRMLQSGAPIIPIVVDSFGGQVYSLLGMIDIIESCPVPVMTYSTAKSMSCGAFLAAFGTKGFRYASPLTTVMLHSISGFDYGKLEEMKSNVKEMDRLSEIVFGKLDRVTGNEQHFFKALIKENLNADLFITAEEAKKYGLVDHIGTPNLTFKFGLTSQLLGIESVDLVDLKRAPKPVK